MRKPGTVDHSIDAPAPDRPHAGCGRTRRYSHRNGRFQRGGQRAGRAPDRRSRGTHRRAHQQRGLRSLRRGGGLVGLPPHRDRSLRHTGRSDSAWPDQNRVQRSRRGRISKVLPRQPLQGCAGQALRGVLGPEERRARRRRRGPRPNLRRGGQAAPPLRGRRDGASDDVHAQVVRRRILRIHAAPQLRPKHSFQQ